MTNPADFDTFEAFEAELRRHSVTGHISTADTAGRRREWELATSLRLAGRADGLQETTVEDQLDLAEIREDMAAEHDVPGSYRGEVLSHCSGLLAEVERLRVQASEKAPGEQRDTFPANHPRTLDVRRREWILARVTMRDAEHRRGGLPIAELVREIVTNEDVAGLFWIAHLDGLDHIRRTIADLVANELVELERPGAADMLSIPREDYEG